MKFGNVALYCKGWYQMRPGSMKNMWMDMLHCINADGWSLCTKDDVVTWCLHRMDDLRNDENFTHKNQLELSYFWREINDTINRDRWYYKRNLDYEDAIIIHFYHLIGYTEMNCFNENLVKPNENVLPLSYHDAYYNDGKYSSDHKPSITFADMHCDVMERIENSFANFKDQNIKDNEFEETEGWIRGKNWEDVLVILGTDSLLDCEEVEVSGELLCNSGNVRYKDDDFLDLNIYEHCVNFDKTKKYLCRVKHEIEHWNWGDTDKYKLMSILKEI